MAPPKTRDRIVAESLALFNGQGERNVTTNHIAAHLGISPGNLYYHFRNKQMIIAELAFSCKGRGVCPSCTTRRMVETAAQLSDHVFPRLPVRQWVLSVPKRCGTSCNATERC